jgi:hypothetical protein
MSEEGWSAFSAAGELIVRNEGTTFMNKMERTAVEGSIKVVGGRATGVGPAEYHRRALKLWQQMERLNPNKRPRGFVFKAPTWALYEEWRRSQRNPRLW